MQTNYHPYQDRFKTPFKSLTKQLMDTKEGNSQEHLAEEAQDISIFNRIINCELSIRIVCCEIYN